MADTRAHLGSVKQWHDSFAAPTLSWEPSKHSGARLVRFHGIDGRINQPALLDNVLAIHLGGAKRVIRLQGRHKQVRDVEEGFITIMPAVEAARQNTVGPIDFAHVTLTQDFLEQMLVEGFDRDPGLLRLRDHVGVDNPFVRRLFNALLDDVARPQRRTGRRDGLGRHCSPGRSVHPV